MPTALPPTRRVAHAQLERPVAPYLLFLATFSAVLVMSVTPGRIGAYCLHALIGAAGATAGLLGRSYCQHRRHQVIVAALLLLIEAVISVQVVG